MNTKFQNSYQASDFDLLSILSYDGLYLRPYSRNDGGQYVSSQCPQCGGRQNGDRFCVWPHRSHPGFWCRQCGWKGDVFAYIMWRHGVGFRQALEILGVSHSKIKRPTLEAPAIEKPTLKAEIPADLVLKFHERGFERALEYWSQSFIGADIANHFQLGYVDGTYGGHFYQGYTIPHRWGTAYKAVKIRNPLPEAKPKYIQFMEGFSAAGVFNDRHVSLPGVPGPIRQYVLVTEDERTCMMLDQYYPTVAYFPKSDWNHFLPEIFGNIGMVIILADNDEPGLKRATAIKKWLGSNDSLILKADTDKQLSDMAKRTGSIDSVHDWLHKKLPFLLPVKTQYDQLTH